MPHRAQPRRPWHLVVIGLLAAGLVTVGVLQLGPPASGARIAHETVTAEDGVIQSSVSGSGNVEPAIDVAVNFQASGTIAGIDVKLGQHVTAGQLLATLDPSQEQLAVDQAQESLTAAEDQLTSAESGGSSAGDGGSSAGGGGSSAGGGGSSAGGGGSSAGGVSGARGSSATATATSLTSRPGGAEFVGYRPAPVTKTTTGTTTPTTSTTGGGGGRSPQSTTTTTTTTRPQATPIGADSTSGAGTSSRSGGSARTGGFTRSAGSSSSPSAAGSTATSTTSTPSPSAIASAQAAVYGAEANLRSAQLALDKTKLYAPVSGTIVTLESLSVGDSVSAGSTGAAQSGSSAASTGSGSGGGTTGSGSGAASGGGSGSAGSSFAEIVSPHALTMTVSLSESDISSVRVGQPATVTLDALSGVELAAHVSAISTVGTNSGGVVSYTAKLTLDQSDPRVKPGMSASASIITGQAEGVTVPNQALSGSGSLARVQLVQNGRTSTHQVVVGLRGTSRSQIVSGLSAGQQLMVTITLPSLGSSSSSGASSGTLGGRTFGRGFGGGGFGGGGGGGFCAARALGGGGFGGG